MKQHDAPAPPSARQMALIFEPPRVDGMNDAERAKAVLTLAQPLMQAADHIVEEVGDERRTECPSLDNARAQ